MKKILMLFLTVMLLNSCKKEDEKLATDMTLNSYSADTKYRSFDIILQLSFKSDGTALLRAFPGEDVVTLSYTVEDKMAPDSKLHIFGELDKSLYADGLSKGIKIDWTANISRLPYKSEVNGFKAGDYHFMSN
jgi:hypothetical protein